MTADFSHGAFRYEPVHFLNLLEDRYQVASVSGELFYNPLCLTAHNENPKKGNERPLYDNEIILASLLYAWAANGGFLYQPPGIDKHSAWDYYATKVWQEEFNGSPIC